MRIEVLRNFITFADKGSMTGAAKALHISQPTLSRQISSLESELETQLYRRVDGVIKLTAEGRTLYNYAMSIVSMADKALQDIASSKDNVSGSVYIGHGHIGSYALLGEAVRRTHEKHPLIRFNFRSGDTPTMIEEINKGAVDIFLECDVKERPRFNMLPMPYRDEWCLVVIDEPSNPLSKLEVITPPDLENQPVVISRQALENRSLRRWLGDSFSTMNVVATFTVGDPELLVAPRLGNLFAYRNLAEGVSGNARCIPFDPPVYENYGFIWRKDRELSHAAQAFLKELEIICGTQPKE